MTDGGRLDGKVALITGGDSGIGRGIAQRFAREGAAVAFTFRRHEVAASEVKSAIEQAGGRATYQRADVAIAADVQQAVDGAVAAFGALDILVNNAGMEVIRPFLDVPEEEWDRVLAVNLKGPFLCTQAAVRAMLKHGRGGRVINISSVHEDIPMPGNSPYCAAKGGLRMLMRTLCDELAPYGITVNNIGPGAIGTPINQETMADPVKLKRLQAAIPLGRLGTADEVAALAAFLASDEAAYITGSSYFIDGGMSRYSVGL